MPNTKWDVEKPHEPEYLLSLGSSLSPPVAYLAVSKKGSRLKPIYLLTLSPAELAEYDFFIVEGE